ncbi:MAG: sigma-54-dependent Fis family transcriptional regulator [Bacteroidales bacterium]|nr:MAG: sigma-54-dependent Fis family transcriptional regulator [Bacteroidales bacterium]
MAKILVVDDDSTFCIMLKTFLTKKGHEVKEAFSYDEAVRLIKATDFDVLLSDFRLPEGSGLDLLAEAKRKSSDTIVILMTGYADIRIAVSAIKRGAYEYVTKPINPDEILLTITNALSARSGASVNDEDLSNSRVLAKKFIRGISAQAKQVNDYINIVAPTNLSVIIQGDSGTGKEYIAREIHGESKRSRKPFIAIDCGALSKELASSEFFGHLKGSFTGAISDKIGQFEAANGGTLFLDEIGNLPYDVQVNLLRAIQERKVKKIGSSKEVEVDVRIITASNDDLIDAVKRGDFREDLYHRLNEFTISIAPLRDRKSDLTIFANHFLELANHEMEKTIVGFDRQVVDVFMKYPWPGNIRELRNVIRRAVLLETGEFVTIKTLPSEIYTTPDEMPFSTAKPIENLRDSKEKAEHQLIVSTLEKVRFNKSKAAQLLSIDRKTLYNKMKQYGIDY